jgi:hypothetical protein
MTAQLREHLGKMMKKKPEERIVVGPVVNPQPARLPLIALYPARFEISQSLKDTSSDQPRLQETQERIEVDARRPQGPYSLAHTPLRQSVRGELIQEVGSVKERRIRLVEDRDFEIDYQQASLSLHETPQPGGVLRLRYSYVGVFTIREFQQQLLIDIYDTDLAAAEQWASLVTGIILTDQQEFIAAFNTTAKTEYQAGPYLTGHTLNQINFLEGTPTYTDALFNIQLKFNISGQLKLVKKISDGFGLIETIHSPGKTAKPGVDIDIEVD